MQRRERTITPKTILRRVNRTILCLGKRGKRWVGLRGEEVKYGAPSLFPRSFWSPRRHPVDVNRVLVQSPGSLRTALATQLPVEPDQLVALPFTRWRQYQLVPIERFASETSTAANLRPTRNKRILKNPHSFQLPNRQQVSSQFLRAFC